MIKGKGPSVICFINMSESYSLSKEKQKHYETIDTVKATNEKFKDSSDSTTEKKLIEKSSVKGAYQP